MNLSEWQIEQVVRSLERIADSYEEARAAQTAHLMNVASHVHVHAREAWLANLALTERQEARVRAWWAWLDSQPTEHPHEERRPA